MAMNDVTQEQAFDFTRATPKWVWGGTGTLVEVPVDQPAYDHDPVTGEPLGVLIEPSRTNWISNNTSFSLNNADFSSVDDTDPVMGSVVRVTAVAVGESSSGYYMSFGQYPIPDVSLDTSPGILRVIYAKPVTADYVSLRSTSGPYGLTVKLSTAEIVQVSSSVSTYVKALAGGWVQIAFYRTLTVTDNGVNTDYKLLVGSNPKNVSNGYGIEYAVGDEVLLAYPSMYQGVAEGPPQSIIPTAGAAVTRARDNMSRSLRGPDVNPQQGTFVFGAYVPESDADRYVAGRYTNDTNSHRQPIYLRQSGTVESAWVLGDGGRYLQSLTPDTPPGSGDKVIIAVAYNFSLGYVTLSAYGKTTVRAMHVIETSILMAYINFVHGLGHFQASLSASYQATRHVPEFSYYPYAMTEAELEALTAL